MTGGIIDVVVDAEIRIVDPAAVHDQPYRKMYLRANGTAYTVKAKPKNPDTIAGAINWLRAAATPKDKAMKADIVAAGGATLRYWLP
ncbi:hypothetical protein NKJ06_25945 [Mesorhizobium sp. M0293]|uniref:hypothetical protein n=1 Tax=Mesorhizobium sp. M0293 TaxID=2956930 RepID=UPI003336C688